MHQDVLEIRGVKMCTLGVIADTLMSGLPSLSMPYRGPADQVSREVERVCREGKGPDCTM